jgi:Fic family protein
MEQAEIDFLKESNAIENELSQKALDDAMGAWEYAKEHRHNLDLNAVLKIHHLLMRRLNSKIAGKWRVNIAVQVGSKYCSAKSKHMIRKEVQDWLDNCKNNTGLGAEEDIRRWHIAFEEVHPFQDGNGRIGRILMNLQRLNVNLPVLIIKEAEKEDYYKWFRKEFENFPCKRCGAVTNQKYCDACYGSNCRACGRKSYGEDYCKWCWRGAKR